MQKLAPALALAPVLAAHRAREASLSSSSLAASSSSASLRPALWAAARVRAASYRRFRTELEEGFNLLFFGCRNPSEDFIYGDSDLKEWAALGVVDVRPAFSRCAGESEECRYVQE